MSCDFALPSHFCVQQQQQQYTIDRLLFAAHQLLQICYMQFSSNNDFWLEQHDSAAAGANVRHSWAKKHTHRANAVVISIVTLGLPRVSCTGSALLPVIVLYVMVMLHLQPGTAALGCLYMLPQGCLQRG